MKTKPLSLGTCLVLCTFILTSPLRGADYSSTIPQLKEVVREQMSEWGISGISVALVDDQELVYAEGFGEANRDSVFRVGSISKLFNAIAVMQQVEAGKLDLDVPLPADVLPINPFPDQPAVTLRQILCHRSGLQRESTVGGYLDPAEPGIAATVASVGQAVLVTRPNEKTRYSNIGPTIAGHMVERVSGEDYADYQEKHVLRPLGMTRSTWLRERVHQGQLVPAHMRVADGQGGWTRRVAPVFDLGTIPAGNLFASAPDLARFASALLAGGNGLVKEDTLKAMWTPQLTGQKSGFGLAFHVGNYREHRIVSHTGAVYGYSCSLVIVPDAKIAVIVLGNEDICSGRIRPISNRAIALMLKAKLGQALPESSSSYKIADLNPYTGEYESESYWAKIEIHDGTLVGDMAGQPLELRAVGTLKFEVDSRIHDAATAVFRKDKKSGEIVGFNLGGQDFVRAAENPLPLPAHWRKYLGSYGHDFIPLIVSERHGHLYVMTENMVDYRLTPENLNVCELPAGMYVNEHLIFMTDPDGMARRINFCNMLFERE